jgi:hypothetical protein
MYAFEPGQSDRGSRPMRLGPSFTLTGNLLGGYDGNVGAAPGAGAGSVSAAATSGSTAFADLMLEYVRRSRKGHIGVRTLGNMVMYPEFLNQPAPGAKARVFGTLQLGRQHTLEASSQVRSEPMFTAGLQMEEHPADIAAGSTMVQPNLGFRVNLFQRRSFVSSNKAYLTRTWSPRDRTVVSYLYFTQQYDDRNGNNYYHEAAIHYQHSVGRRIGLGGTYTFHDGAATDYIYDSRPLTRQTAAGQAAFAKKLSRRRQLSATVDLGATHIASLDTAIGEPYEHWAPYASASGHLDMSLNWTIAGGYRRDYSFLQAVNAEIFSADTTDLRLSGLLSAHTDLTIEGTWSKGETLIGAGVRDTFRASSVSAQIRVALTSTLSTTASYMLYSHRYSNPSILPTGFPARYDRHAVTVGLMFSTSGRSRGPTDW